MYSIINRARVTLTEEEKSHILNYVKKAHSCNSISCFWLNKLSYITVFEGKKVFPHFCVGILVEKLDSPVTVKKGFTIYEDVAFVDLENNVASTYYISQSFVKALYGGDFFNDRDYFSISAAKNDQEVVFVENIILR